MIAKNSLWDNILNTISLGAYETPIEAYNKPPDMPQYYEGNRQIPVPEELHNTAWDVARRLGKGNRKTADNIYNFNMHSAVMESTLGQNPGVSGVMGLDAYERLKQMIENPQNDRERYIAQASNAIGITPEMLKEQDYMTDWDLATRMLALEALNKGRKAYLDPEALDTVEEQDAYYKRVINPGGAAKPGQFTKRHAGWRSK